ncbi:TonB-dependent receptor [Thalassotalea agarivorans]|uniref:TonB-dependent receptor n=1 Tax=Thalassotalea agarivorans TaxID=349064 RepID=A0A1H9YAE9_THASX|nr:TonB-dependent receptor [Thalassotalea agarivorans]SES65842.1 TonB-dependent receptor [Thalassotalea agarivorans]
MRHQTKKGRSKKTAFKYSLVACAVLGISANAIAQEEQAQPSPDTENVAAENAENNVEVIEVTGQRRNLITAREMKMGADTVMDAISAEDMGSLPDRSVLEAISRLPGVAIERFAAANDPDHFGVEGGGAVVRGLTHARTEFNGRDSFSADSGRGLSFEDVSPELMGSVQVFKNQTADMIEGGIAGTISLNTRKPFDDHDGVVAFTVDGTYADLREEWSPNFSGLISENYDTDAGRFGFLVNYTNATMDVQSDAVQIGRYRAQDRDPNLFVPESVRLSKKLDDRTREGFGGSVQWESPDKTLLVTGEYIRSEATLAWGENVVEWADDGSVATNLLPVEGTTFETDSAGYFESGVMTSDAGWRGDAPGGIYGAKHSLLTRVRDQESQVSDASINIKWTPNENWAFNFDVQQVDADMDILDVSVGGAARAVVGLDRSGSGVADVVLLDPTFNNQPGYAFDSTYLQDPSSYFWRYAMDHISDNEGKELAARFDTEYTLDDSVLTSIMVGVRHSSREQTTRQSTYNWGNLSEGWTANGPRWYDQNTVPYDVVSFDNLARGQLAIEGGNDLLFPAMDMVRDYNNLATSLASVNDSGWLPLAARAGAEGNFLPNEINQTDEMSTAFYVRLNFEGEIGGFEYDANVGARYVRLENDTYGFISYPDDRPDDPNDPTEVENYLPQDQKDFGNGASENTVESSTYDTVLPSLNVKFNITDEFLIRIGWSQAIALPALGNLRNYVSISGQDLQVDYDDSVDPPVPVSAAYDRYTAASGNPYLQPMESMNSDISFEYYFGEGDSLTLALFHKSLENYFINGVTVRDYTNNGATQQVEVAGATNGDEGTIKGFEFAYQQFYDFLPGALSGLGMQFNYTYIDEEGSPNEGLSDDAGDSVDAGDFAFDNLPLEGLSQDNFNVAAMYEKYGISARVAYSWRSDYLLTTRDVITTLPIYNEANGQLDASIFYDVTENWKIGFQGTNLNNNITETTMQVNEDGDRVIRSWFTNDRRYSIVVRGNF